MEYASVLQNIPKNRNESYTVTELKKIVISLNETITYVHWVICYTFHSSLIPSCIPFFNIKLLSFVQHYV
jgi:hypothetical protein